MKIHVRQSGRYSGFSLAEMLAAIVIAAMVLTAVLAVYGRANRASEAVLAKIEAPMMAMEVLQLIARDIDRIMETGDLEVQVQNGLDNGHPSAELVLRRTYKDAKNEKRSLKRSLGDPPTTTIAPPAAWPCIGVTRALAWKTNCSTPSVRTGKSTILTCPSAAV